MKLIDLNSLRLAIESFDTRMAAKYALVSHGNHIPNIQTADNTKFLRNDNTWQTITPKNIGAAASQIQVGSAMSTYPTWYRIAQSPSGINNDFGCFDIMATGSSRRSITRIMAAISFGKNPILQQLAHSTYSATAISKARIVYTETYSKNRAYLEIYAPHTETLTVSVNMVEGFNWTLLTPGTKGEIPEGYSAIEVDLITGGVIISGSNESTEIGNASSADKVNNDFVLQLNGGTVENTDQFTFNGSEPKTVNLTPDTLGIEIPEPKEIQPLTIRLNGGTTEGVDRFTYNGDEVKIINITPDLIGLDGTTGENAHNHTTLSNLSRIDFAAEGTDKFYMKTTIDGANTYLDFYLEDDANFDRFRWMAGIWEQATGTREYTMMTLTPIAYEEARLTLFGNVNATLTEVTGADYAEYFEWEDGNINNEDRRGYFVTIVDNKIKIAKEEDYILGVVSSCPAVVGNSDLYWRKKYLTDEYGAPIKNEDGSFILNPEFNPNIEYIPRECRSEWEIIGMMGVLTVNDDETCEVNGYRKCNNNGIATAYEKDIDTYKVIERINNTTIKIIFK